MAINAISSEELLKTCQTGDMIFWKGPSLVSRAIEKITKCPYSHVSMVIKGVVVAKNGQVFGTPGLVQLFQATTGAQEEIIGGKTVQIKTGVMLNPLASVISNMQDGKEPGDIRRISYNNMDTSKVMEIKSKMKEFASNTLGLPYDSGIKNVPINMRHIIAGKLGIPTKHTNGYYCSDLVAKCLQHAGVLDNEHQSTWYSPKELTSDGPTMGLNMGVTYADHEINILFPENYGYVPGKYITTDGVSITKSGTTRSEKVGDIGRDQTLQITMICNIPGENRIRGRIYRGWVTLKDTKSLRTWVQKIPEPEGMADFNAITTAELLKTAQTGDIILWKGSSPISRLIEAMTHCPYSHASMIVKGEITLANGQVYGKPGLVQMFQATTGSHVEIIDGEYISIQSEVMLNPLDHVMTEMQAYNEPGDIRRISYHNMEPSKVEEIKNKMKEFVKNNLGLPYDSGKLLPINLKHIIAGKLNIPTKHTNGYYCSDLVAKCLQYAGCLGDKHQSTWFAPKEMMSDAVDFNGDLELGVTYGLETNILFPTAGVLGKTKEHDEVLQLVADCSDECLKKVRGLCEGSCGVKRSRDEEERPNKRQKTSKN